METIDKLTEAFSSIADVEAVALSGSRTSQINDASSDYDMYIYSEAPVDKTKRREILSSLTDDYIISASMFEEGDEAKIDGISYDIMYRSLNWIRDQIEDVWIRHNARLGYTTAFIYNIRTSKILFDRNNALAELQKKTETPYPEELRANIINKNLYIIDGNIAAPFMKQLELAVKRDDIVSQNHRLSAILSSYFDILFAYNRALHPGEKKLVKYVHLFCPKLPENFDENIRKVCTSTGEELLKATKSMIDNLHDMLNR